ncbi:hypothetical protein DH2020_045079 [Rehmannia glutinosa]|uniref:WEB family protein n=1 Tax=Rehmannia glutinosa TaxID=99300 RepID=A0ABR0UFU8_REHGL
MTSPVLYYIALSPHNAKITFSHSMEQTQNLDPNDQSQSATAAVDHNPNVDTSRPFRSVKEAVAIFGERIMVGPHIYSPNPFTLPKKDTPNFSPSPKLDKESSSKYSSPSTPRSSSYTSHDTTLFDTVRKLEAELDHTKAELKLLKERESETEVALASLNAELHKNMSELAARAEAAKPAASGPVSEEEKKRDLFGRMENSHLPILAQVLGVGEKESLYLGRKKEKKGMKKKPIIPLVGDLLFFRKKGSSNTLDNPLYASSPLNWN